MLCGFAGTRFVADVTALGDRDADALVCSALLGLWTVTTDTTDGSLLLRTQPPFFRRGLMGGLWLDDLVLGRALSLL